MTRAELIELGNKIKASEGTEAELDTLCELFNANVPHPAGANLFFYPEDYNARIDRISEYNPSVTEIVDKCLAYKPIAL